MEGRAWRNCRPRENPNAASPVRQWVCRKSRGVLNSAFPIENNVAGIAHLIKEISSTDRHRKISKNQIFLTGEDEAVYVANFTDASLGLMTERFRAPEITRRRPASLANLLRRHRIHQPDETAARIILLGREALPPAAHRIAPLKNEMLQGGSFTSEADARIEIFDFIELYYNHDRKRSALSYQTPAQFEAKIHSNN